MPRLATIALGFLTAAGGLGAAEGTAPATPDARAAAPPAVYAIGAGDVLRIVVWKEPDLTADATVRLDGMITLPLLGDVHAAGHTPGDLAADLTRALGEYVEKPRVTVGVREALSARVYVVGEMLKPGEFPLTGGMTVLKALALAGGFKEFARRDGIVVVRGDQVIPFHYKRVVEGREMSENVLLAAGDTIVVP